MSSKAIYFLIVVLLFALFASFNLENYVTISLGFWKIEHIPVFLFSLFSFLIGFLFMVPFFFRSKKPDTKLGKKNEKPTEPAASSETINGIQEVELKGEKKSWLQKLKESKKNDENKK